MTTASSTASSCSGPLPGRPEPEQRRDHTGETHEQPEDRTRCQEAPRRYQDGCGAQEPTDRSERYVRAPPPSPVVDRARESYQAAINLGKG